jgi:O-antigen/teichoic acid export membrane protein
MSNFAANLFAIACTVGVQLGSVPVFLFFWPKERYGEWILVSSIPTYLALAEAGFATTAGNEIGMAVAEGKMERARCSLHTAWGFIVAVSILVLGLASIASFAVPWTKWLGLYVLEAGEVPWVMLLLSVYTVAGLLYSILGAVYRAGYKNARIAFLTNTGRLIEFVAMAASVVMSQSVITLSRNMLATRVAMALVVYLDSRRISPIINLGLKAFCAKELKRTWQPSVLFMAMSLGNALYLQGLTILVGICLGASAVVIFNTTRTLTRTIVQFVTLIKHSTFIEFAYLFGSGEFTQARRLNGLVFEISWVLSITSAFVVYFLAPYVMSAWTNRTVEIDRALLSILLLCAVLNSMWFIFSGLLQGVNRHQRMAIFYLLATSISFLMGMLLVRPFGLAGVAWAMVGCEMLLVPFVIQDTCRLIQCSPLELLTNALCLDQSFLLLRRLAGRYFSKNP